MDRDHPRPARARRSGRGAHSRDPDKARGAFGKLNRLENSPTRLDNPQDLADPSRNPHGLHRDGNDRNKKHLAADRDINAAAGRLSIEQVTPPIGAHRLGGLTSDADQPPTPTNRRLDGDPVLDNQSRNLLGVVTRNHARGTRLADIERRPAPVAHPFMALIDHRDVAEAGMRILADSALWGVHHDVTGPAPMSVAWTA